MLKAGAAIRNHRRHTRRWKASGCQSRRQKAHVPSVISRSHWTSLGITTSKFLDERDNKDLPYLSHHWLLHRFLLLANKCAPIFSYLPRAKPANSGAEIQIQIFLTKKQCSSTSASSPSLSTLRRLKQRAYFVVCDGYISRPFPGLPLSPLPSSFRISPRYHALKQALAARWLRFSPFSQILHDLEKGLANSGPWAKSVPLPLFVQPTI